ncbi:MAG: hypothetical protein HKN16_11285, partial [Saprospiraceae bacterium]|nr:hypothetical protein [Saprospiraceae bacterium]
MHAIISYLALLEILNQGKAVCTIGQGTNNFWVSAVPIEEIEKRKLSIKEEA